MEKVRRDLSEAYTEYYKPSERGCRRRFKSEVGGDHRRESRAQIEGQIPLMLGKQFTFEAWVKATARRYTRSAAGRAREVADAGSKAG